jgi:hypothetical protein
MVAWGFQIYEDAKSRPEQWTVTIPPPETPVIPETRLQALAAKVITQYDAARFHQDDGIVDSTPQQNVTSVRVNTASGTTVVMGVESSRRLPDGDLDPAFATWVGLRAEYSNGDPAMAIDLYAMPTGGTDAHWAQGDHHTHIANQVVQYPPMSPAEQINQGMVGDASIFTEANTMADTPPHGVLPRLGSVALQP